MKRFIIVIILMAITCSVQAWDETAILSESCYCEWQSSRLANDLIYSCWETAIDSSFVILVQGVDPSGQSLWQEPVTIQSEGNRTLSYKIYPAESGSIFFMYAVEDDYGYYQGLFIYKIDENGQFVWEDSGIMLDFPNYYTELISDNYGGFYLFQEFGNMIKAWHYDQSCNLLTGWQNGIILGDQARLDYKVTDDGNLAIYRCPIDSDEPGMFFQILLADGACYYPGDGIFCGDCNSDGAELIPLPYGNWMFCSIFQDIVIGNVFMSNEEFLYDEPIDLVELDTGNSLIKSLARPDGCYLIFKNSTQMEVTIWQFDQYWQTVNQNITLPYEENYRDTYIKPDGNIIITYYLYPNLKIMEYNDNAQLISPTEGWFSDGEIKQFIGIDSAGSFFLTQKLFPEPAITDYMIQGMNINQQNVFPDNGHLICRDINLRAQDCHTITLDNKTAFYWYEFQNEMFCLRLQYVDENGNCLLQPQGLPLITRNAYDVKTNLLLQDDNSLLISEHFQDEWFGDEEYCKIHKICLDDQPWLPWGNEGVTLTQTANTQPSAIKRADDDYFIYWKNTQNTISGQLLVNGEFILPDNHDLGLEQDEIISITGNYCVHPYGYQIAVTRWDDELQPVWDEPLTLTAASYFDGCSYACLDDENLVVYWISYEGSQMQDFTWRIKKQIITPQGEKMLAQFGDMIFDNDDQEITGFYYLEEIDQLLVLANEQQEFKFRYMTMDDNVFSDYIYIPALDGHYNLDAYNQNGYLIFESIFNDSEYTQYLGLAIFDYEGNSIPGLPDADFGLPYFYYNTPNFVTSDEFITYCWSYQTYPIQKFSYYNLLAQNIPFAVNATFDNLIPALDHSIKAFPNPFNPSLDIAYQLDQINNNSNLSIFNIKGQKIREFKLEEKSGSIRWNGKNELNQNCASGVYFLRIDSPSQTLSQKVILLK